MYRAIEGEELKIAIFDIQTSFWGLNRSEFDQQSSHGVQKNPETQGHSHIIFVKKNGAEVWSMTN